MIKEIKYNGYSANPSDYECADGDLATTMGLIQEDGTMKPVLPPSLVLQLESGESVKYIHETANFKHYIILKTNGSMQWWDGKETSTPASLRTFTTTIYQVTSVGNTLIVLASDGMHYFLWKGTSEGYLYLGTEIPECPLSFGLQGEYIEEEKFKISYDAISFKDDDSLTTATDPYCAEFTDSNKKNITNQVLAKVNKFIAEHSTSKGKFIYPFLLRYAYRLYDGTLTKHSAPILMICSSDLCPEAFVTRVFSTNDDDSANRAEITLSAVLHTLDYSVVSQSKLEELKKWTDIIRSVDIFVSKPIYTYDQNGECERFVRLKDSDSYTVCKVINQKASTSTYPMRYQKHNMHYIYSLYHNNFSTIWRYRLKLPSKSVDAVKEDIRSCSQFYLLESMKIDQLSTTRIAINVEEDYLQSLVTREVMTDDYDSHDKIMPQYAFPYNGRLNLSNVKKTLFAGHSAYSLFPHSDGYVYKWGDISPTMMDITESVTVYVYIKQDGRDIVVRGDTGSIGFNAPILFFYYPNVNAYKAVIVKAYYPPYDYYEVPLVQHDFLNGAFYFGGWDDLSVETTTSPTASSIAERTINIANKIYTSEVNNPFYFPVLGINTVGTGNILGICAAAKALSEGQFGQFPLYAFTTEGVWALEVSNTGTYSAKQPITRDVVINPDSITQIDSAVLFATDRGIMHISGSTVQCISDRLNTEEMFSIADLPKCDKLINIFNGKANESEQITIDDISLLPFNEFLQGCRMVYDYTNQHLIVYNPAVRYAYVYSLKSQTWGMMRSDIVDNVNSYPEALAMADGAKLVDFSKPVAENITALIITRPFKIDDPNTFKTINTIIQRGMFRSTHVQQVLYGSNDLIHWHTVWSSVDKIMRGFRGTPYKAFRLALVCKFDKGESIYGCTVVYEPRMANQVR